ncbi:flagellar hook-basal body complex protein FliE [Duganella sp. FT80W]|uniref:Flagellar hook-basal body complex protein FliE n=1 Tax=Duganella guangzhouensis TaxID=2666084 RepID=A0A6I2L8R9_9BURK|nr:flagellar hook-basal body complex protein FliE [Duganella guangzhouensis]MRW94170.1 flagellar hook-basal body complex protein FliE [Duganella guangzhouensis]
MTVEAISAGAAMAEALKPVEVQQPAAGFGNWFTAELEKVNTGLVQSDQEAQRLALGEPLNLHEVMIHMEEAKLSFQLLAAVRNRMLEAYQEVMRTQV